MTAPSSSRPPPVPPRVPCSESRHDMSSIVKIISVADDGRGKCSGQIYRVLCEDNTHRTLDEAELRETEAGLEALDAWDPIHHKQPDSDCDEDKDWDDDNGGCKKRANKRANKPAKKRPKAAAAADEQPIEDNVQPPTAIEDNVQPPTAIEDNVQQSCSIMPGHPGTSAAHAAAPSHGEKAVFGVTLKLKGEARWTARP